MLGPNAKRAVDGSPIAEAMRQTIPDQLILENPQRADAIAANADVYRRPFTVEQLDDFLKTTNAQLESYYNKYPTSQRKALAGDPQVAALEAKAKAIRDVLYKALDDPGQGAAARELNQRYGSLINLESEAHRRLNVALRQAPESLSEQISKWSAAGQAAKGIFRLMRGDMTGAADIGGALTQRQMAQWLKEQNTSDALIKAAFKNYNTPSAPVDIPPPFKPAGLLGKGPIVTPPPPDTSGIKVTTGPPLRAPNSRLLTQGPSIRPSVGELSGRAGDPIDTIPIKDPTTGQIQYVPRYAKGGVIKRPTVLVDMASGKPSGIMGEAGPERIVPETAAHPTVPEKPDTIGVQLQQLQDGKRRVVMIPQGSFPAPVPHGMQQHADAHGNRYIFNPSAINQHEIKLAIATNRLPSILGAAAGGMGAPDKSRLKGKPVNVVARKKNGTEIQSTVADKKSVPSAVRQSRKLAPRSGSVSVESPSIQIARRVS
jgi:hypothetical protein